DTDAALPARIAIATPRRTWKLITRSPVRTDTPHGPHAEARAAVVGAVPGVRAPIGANPRRPHTPQRPQSTRELRRPNEKFCPGCNCGRPARASKKKGG